LSGAILDRTHDECALSWVETANTADAAFPIQNLPFGIFRRTGSGEAGRVGVAIGDQILNLAGCIGQLGASARTVAEAVTGPTLHALMALDPEGWTALRLGIFDILEASSPARSHGGSFLVPQAAAETLLPVRPGSFIDFFASIDHATNAGRIFRPDNPLLPNYRYVPIGYNGRVSTIGVSGTPITRPNGQVRRPNEDGPAFGPSRNLDFEVELGLLLGGRSEIGSPVAVSEASRHLFGVCLLNDWSARDIQAWEYQPLGPFLGKTFGTTISPWIVTADALRPFQAAARRRGPDEPQPLPYLFCPRDQAGGALDITVEAYLRTRTMAAEKRPAHRLSHASAAGLFWTPAQVIAHQTSNGCNLEPGDLYGSGTISGPGRDNLGSLLEISRNGAEPFQLPNGESRRFLEDGDEITLKASCVRAGFRSIGFGVCAATILEARPFRPPFRSSIQPPGEAAVPEYSDNELESQGKKP
jgi:fumarylacetoacetase